MHHLVLFDVDGTLVLTGGAGVRAMNRAFEETFQSANAFQGISMPGRTDQIILSDALSRLKRRLDPHALEHFRESYCRWLRHEIAAPGPRKGTMPGVRELLDALSARDDVSLALLTGNFATAAKIKLEYFDLWHYFACGAYGDDAIDRNDLVRVAVDRARRCGTPDLAARQVLVVGDTPLDVECASAAGARPIGVATGMHSVDVLRASGAEVVFEDFRDTGAFLELLDKTAPENISIEDEG